MKVLVCGSRDYTDEAFIFGILDNFLNGQGITEIIAGEARGVDAIAKRYAKSRAILYRGFPAEWDKYGRSAGPIRNKQMLDEGQPDMVIAFRRAESKGTTNMIRQAQDANIETFVYEVK